jgi:predicted NUDIX family NTP pyrophosphohydrolase
MARTGHQTSRESRRTPQGVCFVRLTESNFPVRDESQCLIEIEPLLMQESSKSQRSRVSAGLLMFRRKGGTLEVLLAHPGGPFFARKDEGAWTIPKGEAAPDEDLLTRAQIEFEEEVGIPPHGNWIGLGSIKQKGGKIVHAWAFEGDLPNSFQPKSNTFEMEWPPRSGKLKQFPEIDRAEFFAEEIARRKIKPAQVPFFDRLADALNA